MKGPFALVLAAGMCLLVVAVYFSLAPSIGGSMETANPTVDKVVTMTLLNNTNVSTGYRNIGGVIVYNNTGHTKNLGSDEFSYDSDVGTITLLEEYATHNNVNGTYYAEFDYSRWNNAVNSDIIEGGTWFSDNATWVTLLFLGICAAIVISMFVRW